MWGELSQEVRKVHAEFMWCEPEAFCRGLTAGEEDRR